MFFFLLMFFTFRYKLDKSAKNRMELAEFLSSIQAGKENTVHIIDHIEMFCCFKLYKISRKSEYKFQYDSTDKQFYLNTFCEAPPNEYFETHVYVNSNRFNIKISINSDCAYIIYIRWVNRRF